MSFVQHLDITIHDANAEDDIRKILPKLRPLWQSKDVIFKTSPTGTDAGFLNLMITCGTASDMKDGLVFRIHRMMALSIYEYLNREKEIKNIQMVKMKYGFAPNIIATFTNGFCYEYVQGEVMTPETIRLPNNWRLIAKQLGILHSTKLPVNERENSKIANYWDVLSDTFPESLKDPKEHEKLKKYLPSKTDIEKEKKLIFDHLSTLDCDYVFCHNDTRPENMIWNANTGDVTFVDWECAGMSRRAYEIAYHFRNYAGFEKADFTQYPNKEFQMEWLRVYLQSYFSVIKPKYVVSDEEVEKLYVQVNVNYLLFLIQNACFIGMGADVQTLPFNFLGVSVASYKEYKRVKNGILGLKIPSTIN